MSDQKKQKLEEHIFFRKSLLDVMIEEVDEFKRSEGDYLYLSSRDFMIENMQMITDLTSYPEYMDDEVADKATQVIYKLT